MASLTFGLFWFSALGPILLIAGAVGFWLLLRRRRGPTANPHLAAFRREVQAACAESDEASLQHLLERRRELGLSEDEAALELEMIEGLLALATLKREVDGGALPVIQTQHRVLGPDRCHFCAPAFPAERPEASGSLFLTDRRVVFLSGCVTSMRWADLRNARRIDRDIVFIVAGSEAIHRFRCNMFADAMRAVFIAQQQIGHAARQTAVSVQPATQPKRI